MLWRTDDERWSRVGVVHPRVGRILVGHPILSPVVVASLVALIPLSDRPVERSVVLVVPALFAIPVLIAALWLRRQVRREEMELIQEPLSEPDSNVRPANSRSQEKR